MIFADAEPPAAMVPSVHVTGPVPVHPNGADADTNVVVAGSVSVTCTAGTAAAPLLFTVTVYWTSLPALTGSGVPVIDVASVSRVTVSTSSPQVLVDGKLASSPL